MEYLKQNFIEENNEISDNNSLNKNNKSFDCIYSSNKNKNIKKEYEPKLNSILKKANSLKSEYIKQRTFKEDLFESEEITLKNEEIMDLYNFGDRQFNLIEVKYN